jgi:hypothetical protein
MSWRYGSYGLAALALACGNQADPPPSGGMYGVNSDGTLPCEVQTVLQNNCVKCHDNPPKFTAPMSLKTWNDTQAFAREAGQETKRVWERINERIHDPVHPMPEGPASLSPGDMAILDNWLRQKAPPGAACGAQAPPGAGGGSMVIGGGGAAGRYVGVGGNTNPGGGGSAGVPVGGGAGGAPAIIGAADAGTKPADGECNYIELTARSDAAGTPFKVPYPTVELYQSFGFHVDLQGSKQAFSFHPMIDNDQVIHHWLLYQVTTPQTTGESHNEGGFGAFHADGTLLAGWAPGAGDWNLPPDVGSELSSNDFVLEVHYNNQVSGKDMTDKSGVRICAGKTPRANTAGLSWLGNDAFGLLPGSAIPPATMGAKIAGRCRPNLTGPVHILTSWPHMHKRGRHMSAQIDRAGGTTEMLFDEPFDFNKQWQYSTPTVINPGDSILTTCTFDNTDPNPVGFGEQTSQEMCFNFTLAYPAHALVLQTLHNNSCIGAP